MASPYVIKAIGNPNDMSKTLNFPNEGIIPAYKNRGYTIEMNTKSDITIKAYDKEISLKYMQEKKEE